MPDTNFDSLRVAAGPVKPYALETIRHFGAGAQTTGVKKMSYLIPVAGVITDVRAYLDTAPTGATFILDVNVNGTTIFTTQGNRPTVAISGNASTTVVPDVTTVAVGDRLSVDIDQIGSSVAGSDLQVAITIKRLTSN